ncbi:hypothetical protein WL29_22505 [Burkholderia ubonensis]|uniref:Uncharacterized protein n=1 Tax=Burkholderia ubonensis TaxID=101571 RepID=A0A106QD96_9BURK|nr:hypothetical protein [Burkholderia ubonensis]KWA84138.1 hypothetical protein WL29_22505 [Burkholderia ubonensis]
MALTAEQKAANKQKQQARDRAYRERYREWQAARDKALAPLPRRKDDVAPGVAPGPESLAAWDANTKLDEAVAAAEQEEAAIREQIARLQESLKGVRERHNTTALAAVRRNAYDALNAARTAAEKAVDAQFADVAHVYSAVEWSAKTGFDADTA